MAARALGEDVQDQTVAVDHAALQRALQIALLARRQRVVEDHHVGAGGAHHGGNLLHLALAGEQRRIRALALALHHAQDFHLAAAHQLGAFRDAFLVVGITKIQADQDGLVA